MPKPVIRPTKREDIIREEMRSAAEHGVTRTRPISRHESFRAEGRQRVAYSQGSTVIPDHETMLRNDMDFEIVRPRRINPYVVRRAAQDVADELRRMLSGMPARRAEISAAESDRLLERLAELAAAAEDFRPFEDLRMAVMEAVLGPDAAKRVQGAQMAAGTGRPTGGTVR